MVAIIKEAFRDELIEIFGIMPTDEFIANLIKAIQRDLVGQAANRSMSDE